MATNNSLNNDISSCTGLPVAGIDATGTPSSANFLRGDGAWAAATSVNGNVVQIVTQTNATSASTTATIPFDNTKPQNTEGAEYTTLSITPTSATNTLMIIFSTYLSRNGAASSIVALFQDSDADALAATPATIAVGNYAVPITMVHIMTAGTTSSTTFKIRYGGQTGTTYVGRNVGVYFDGIGFGSFNIIEIEA